MSAAMSQDENSTEKTLAGMMESPDLTPQRGSVKLLMEKWESASAPRPNLVLQHPPAPRSLAREKSCHVSTVKKVLADSGSVDMIKEEPLGGPREIETFPIAMKELQSHFESLGGRKGAESEMSSLSPARTSQPGSNSDMMESSVKRRRAIFEMFSEDGQNSNTEVSVGGRKPLGGLPEESPPKTGNTPLVFQENVSLKDKLALYQAAASKAEISNSFANISEEIKSCTAPGGLAAVRRQFENGQTTSSRITFARSQQQQKSAQETSITTQPLVSTSTREADCSGMASKESPVEAFQTEEVSHEEKVTPETNGDKASTVVQHADETVVNATMNGEIPKISTQICNMEKALHNDREAATSVQDGKFLRCTESVRWRSENKCQKVEDQPFLGAQKMEVLCQPKYTMPSAASRIKAINAIIKNQQHAVRCPHHLGAGAPIQRYQRSEFSADQVLPKPQEPRKGEPLRQPKRKISSAASRLKTINEIHKNQRNTRRHPNQQEAALLADNAQWFETTECNGKDKDGALTGCVVQQCTTRFQ
ncbi:uncharacterized protein [Anser cygnoides]|uniref:uncharacterized protein n=1 Tax=Anser cygnoides TaxID=8845 RepID=UPI0034D1D104